MSVRAFLAALLAVVGLAFLTTPASADTAPACDRGELCLWSASSYRGEAIRLSLSNTNPGECVPLWLDTRSFANLLSRAVTMYQSVDCATEGEFDTYPGQGTYVPCAPFVVRAVQVWST